MTTSSLTAEQPSTNVSTADHTCDICDTRENAPSPSLPASPSVASPALKREFPLSNRQRHAIKLLVAGHPDGKVAKAVGVHRSTLHRWRIYHSTFQTQLNRQRNSLWVNNSDRLRSLMTHALDTLEKHMDSSNERAAFRSAVSILRLARHAPPTGPLDEYELLEQHYRRCADEEISAKNLCVRWPPEKCDLDALQELFLKRAQNQPVARPPRSEPSPPVQPILIPTELRP